MAELIFRNVDVVMPHAFNMTPAEIKVFGGVRHLGNVYIAGRLKHAQSENYMLGRRGNTSIALALNVGFAFHVMAGCEQTRIEIFIRPSL